MKKNIVRVITGFALMISATTSFGELRLTGVSVFSANSSGGYSPLDTWASDPGSPLFKTWIQDGNGTFLNGPSSSLSKPNALLVPGTASYRVLLSPGADASYFAMNLFFNTELAPAISVYAPMRTTQGSTLFYANSSVSTPKQDGLSYAPGSGSLTYESGNYKVSLTDFYLAKPSVYNLDLVNQFSTGPNGEKDYVAGMTLSVQVVPEPGFSALIITGLLILAGRKSLRL